MLTLITEAFYVRSFNRVQISLVRFLFNHILL